jgi:BMFP domain-containing protein YqiC
MSALPATLYQIEDDLIFVLDSLESLPDEEQGMRAELEEQLARLVAAELRKVDGVTRMLAHFEAQADMASGEIKRLQLRKKGFENSYDRLESCARLAMEVSGKTKLEGETSTLSLQKNPPSVHVTQFNEVPEPYHVFKVDESIDKAAVARDLKAGITVPGAELVQSTRLVRR